MKHEDQSGLSVIRIARLFVKNNIAMLINNRDEYSRSVNTVMYRAIRMTRSINPDKAP